MSSPEALTELQSGILAFLEEGPQVVEDLARQLTAPRSQVIAELHTLRTAGAATNLRFGVWALAGYEPPAKMRRAKAKASGPERVPDVQRAHENVSCAACGLRYAQEHDLCRRCSRERGLAPPPNFELDRARVAEEAARLDALRRPAPVASGVRAEVIGGVEFEVLSIGGRELLPPRDGGSSLMASAQVVGKRRMARPTA